MTTGTSEIFGYRITYCSFKVLYDECKWWQFLRKSVIKEQLDWVYPLMRQEVKNLPVDKEVNQSQTKEIKEWRRI